MKLLRILRKPRPSAVDSHLPGFDEAYYRLWYPDVAQFGGTPLQHYLRHGWREGRDPSAGFSGNGYLTANPDVRAERINPLTHFLKRGLAEGRTGWHKDPTSPAPIGRFDYGSISPALGSHVETCPVFMYWTHPEIREPAAASAWRRIYHRFRVFSDDDVIPLLPDPFVPVFQSILLPSAKSDIARLFLLRAHGGLFVDAHVGPAQPSDLMETLGRLSDYNLLLFGQRWLMPKETDFNLMNGVLAARCGAPELDVIIDRLLRNVRDQKVKEDATPDHVPYDLHVLTGTYVIVQAVFDLVPPRPRLKPEYRDTTFVHLLDNNAAAGFQLYADYVYRQPDNHWSERQKRERFFRKSG
ncbi:hypothetical protein [Methylobacterium sp. J-078]|uniref:hypothetical protein n=1 Tax=Methylobacterium sp. J-078 TaxID=2836657 RepID=UPI0028BE47FC|nr:hypothetical protein [Methylobacterium sp. J-078]